MAISLAWGIGILALAFADLLLNLHLNLSPLCITSCQPDGGICLKILRFIGIASTLPTMLLTMPIATAYEQLFGRSPLTGVLTLYILFPLFHIIIFWYIGNLSGRIAVFFKKLYNKNRIHKANE